MERSRPTGRVTILTDFGLRDAYVGIMKGVMAGICPGLEVVDLTHNIPPQQVAQGARILASAWPWFPPGTIHLAVVDPGVGSTRRALVVQADGHVLVGPDNGLLTSAMERPGAVVHQLSAPRFRLPTVSHTFHGRDVFAPAVAWLARGISPADMGPQISDGVLLNLAAAPVGAQGGEGEVAQVDHFGNLITNFRGEDVRGWLEQGGRLVVGGVSFHHLCTTYTDVEADGLLILVGSTGMVEVSQRGGSAQLRLGVGLGSPVVLTR